MKVDLRKTRFYGLLDTGYVSREHWREKCHALLEGGADLIQLRAKKESPAARRELLEDILPLFAETQVPLIINDDLDLARQFPGLGLHIGQDDVPAAEARARLGPERLLGLSTHSLEQAQNAIALGNILDYFSVGPVFPTGTKPEYTPVGLGLVRQVAALQPPLPFFCIGGITRQNAAQVKAAGARRAAAVSDVLLASGTAAAVRAIRRVFL